MTIKLSFQGAARTVTGSRYLLDNGRARVLVDCGYFQERAYQKRNWAPFSVDPATIDAVLLTHAHLDHCGLLPKLVHEGFKGKVFCTAPTAEIAPVVLKDSAYIQKEDARRKAKRHRRAGRKSPHPPEPLFTKADVAALLPLFKPVEVDTLIEIAPGMKARFHGAGHILGSSSIKVEVSDEEKTRSVVFSGDVGRWDRPIIKDPAPFVEADYVLVESTYGDRLHDDTDAIQDRLADLVNATFERGGNILIPSFAIERAQEVLYRLALLRAARRIPAIPVFLDSPMAVRVTEVFKHNQDFYDEEMNALLARGGSPFNFKGLTYSRSRDDSKAINAIRGTVIIIAGSGMCNGGRIKHHLLHNIHRPESAILFVGYQARGTLGREIVNGAERVRVLGQREIRVRAQVEQIHGFSGHADRDELLRWLSALEGPKHVFATHGGEQATQRFAGLINERFGWSTSAPEYGQTVTLD